MEKPFSILRSLSVFWVVIFCAWSVCAQNVLPTGGLVSWWRAEGNASDSADGNHGTAFNGASYGSGILGSSFLLDGVNDHIRVPNSGNLNLTTALTLGAWVNPSTRGTYDSIIDKWDVAFGINQRSFTFSIHPNGEAYLTLDALGTSTLVGIAFSTNTTVPLNTWTHVAGTYDGAFVRIYINGVLKGQTAYTSGIKSSTDDLGIGGFVGGASLGDVGSPFAGRIDEAVIYNRALSPSEIVTLATIPEPSSMSLLIFGSLSLLAVRRLNRD